MADTPRRSPRELRSWRAQPENERTSPLVRRVQRVIVSLVVLLLAAAMVYVLVPRHRPTTHVAYLPIHQYVVLKANALPETVVSPDMLEHFSRQTLVEPVSMAPMQTSNFFLPREAPNQDGAIESTFGASVHELTNYGDDAVIVFLSAHGVSIQGEACLLMGDFDPTRAQVGISKLQEVLNGVSRSTAGRKLLILDAGQIVSDPRLGMLVNEFPQLLDDAVRQHSDSDLWVLCSHWMLETSHMAYSRRRSVFSEYVARGLSGEADRDGGDEPYVDLRELFEFVSINVPDWVRRTRGPSVRQTPVLLRGGRGHVRTLGDVDTIALMPVLPPEPVAPPEPAEEAEAAQLDPSSRPRRESIATAGWQPQWPLLVNLLAADEEPTAAATPATAVPSESSPTPPASATDQTTPPATDPAAPAATPAQPPAESPPPLGDTDAEDEPADPLRQQVRRLLDEAWQLRDLAQSKPRGSVGRRGAPVDFAPHLWREFQERIYGYELQYRCGISSDYLMSGLNQNVLPMRQVVEQGTLSAVDNRSLARPLADEWVAYQRLYGATSDESDVTVVERAMTVKNDLFDQAAYYVRWHSQAVLLAPGSEPPFDTVRDLLGSLNELASLLESSTTASKPLNVQQLTQQLTRLDDLDQQVAQSEPTPDANAPLGAVECYLRTPLPQAASRKALLDRLVDDAQLENDVFDELTRYAAGRTINPSDSIGPQPIDGDAWQRIALIAELELALSRAAQSDLATSSDETSPPRLTDDLGSAVERLHQNLTEPIGPERWTLIREMGDLLHSFYIDLPGAIATLVDPRANSGSTSLTERAVARLIAERLYRVVDARDASNPNIPPLVPYLSRPDAVAVETQLVLEADSSPLALDPQQGATPLKLVARARAGRPNDAWLVLDYDESLLEVRDNGRYLHQSGPVSLANLRNREPSFSFVRGQERIHQIDVLVRAKSTPTGQTTGADSPRLDAHLYFVEDDGIIRGPISLRVPIRLPIPDVDLLIVGPQDERRVDHQAVTVLRPFPNQTTTYQLQLTNRASDEQEVSVEFIAVPESMGTQWPKQWPIDELGELKPGIAKTVIAQAQQKVAPGATVPLVLPLFPPAPVEGDAPAEESAPPPPPDMTYGFVAVVTDQAGRRAVRFVDVLPRRPREYLSVAVSWDTQRENRVRIDVVPRNNDLSLLPTAGSIVQWDWQVAGIPADAPRADVGQIKPPESRKASLYADVPASRSSALTIQLNVDHVPRAFIYEIQPGQPVRPERSLQRIAITQPAEDGQAISAPRDTMPIEFQVDAPADAFLTAQRELDFIEIGVVDPNGAQYQFLKPPLRFHSDRQHRAQLAALTPEGTFGIQTTVGDFSVELDTLRKSNEMIGVLARFEFDGREQYDLRKVLLDASPPQIVEFGTTERGALAELQGIKGQDLNIYAKVEDRGLVEKVEFFLLPTSFDVEADWQFDDKLATPPIVAVLRADHWTAKIATAELKPGRLLLLARATDQAGLRNKATLPVEISTPPTPDDPSNPTPKLSDLEGVVTAGGRPTLGMTVSLVEQGRPPVRTSTDGRFSFAKLPPGPYQVAVRGSVRNRLVERTVDVTLPRAQPLVIAFD